MLWENDRFIILNVKYLWHSTIFANTKSNNLQKSFSSSSSFSFQTFVHFHDCHVRYELNAFTNKSSRLHILSIDKRKKNQLIASKRNWKKTKNKCDERASISTSEINIWSIIKINIFILLHRNANSNFAMIKFFTYVLSDFSS